jgi:hypothetical protein
MPHMRERRIAIAVWNEPSTLGLVDHRQKNEGTKLPAIAEWMNISNF